MWAWVDLGGVPLSDANALRHTDLDASLSLLVQQPLRVEQVDCRDAPRAETSARRQRCRTRASEDEVVVKNWGDVDDGEAAVGAGTDVRALSAGRGRPKAHYRDALTASTTRFRASGSSSLPGSRKREAAQPYATTAQVKDFDARYGNPLRANSV